MILVLTAWALLAPWMLLARRALWIHVAPSDDAATAKVDNRVVLTLTTINDACRIAADAAAAGQTAPAAKILRGMGAGVVLLARDMQRELLSWGASTWALDGAVVLAPFEAPTMRMYGLRTLPVLEDALGLVLPGHVARLRVRLFALRWSWRILAWQARRISSSPPHAACPDLAHLLADLRTLVDATLHARAALLQSRSARRVRWSLAT